MKTTLAAGLKAQKSIAVDEGRCISFMGREAMVYATPHMVSDVEYFCRNWLLSHLDAGEDSVGTHVTIDHLAATPLGMNVTLSIEVAAVDRRKVEFTFSAHDGIDECGKGKHVRFVVESSKTQERLAAKRAKAGLK
jgi:fluoroacetyl-CoA thioesterase